MLYLVYVLYINFFFTNCILEKSSYFAEMFYLKKKKKKKRKESNKTIVSFPSVTQLAYILLL